MGEESNLRCPVCNAPFRESADCSRCGADLRPLFRILASASRYRANARSAILAHDFDNAQEAAAHARSLHDTPSARRLDMLTKWLHQMMK